MKPILEKKELNEKRNQLLKLIDDMKKYKQRILNYIIDEITDTDIFWYLFSRKKLISEIYDNNQEIDELYNAVKIGTRIEIKP